MVQPKFHVDADKRQVHVRGIPSNVELPARVFTTAAAVAAGAEPGVDPHFQCEGARWLLGACLVSAEYPTDIGSFLAGLPAIVAVWGWVPVAVGDDCLTRRLPTSGCGHSPFLRVLIVDRGCRYRGCDPRHRTVHLLPGQVGGLQRVPCLRGRATGTQ